MMTGLLALTLCAVAAPPTPATQTMSDQERASLFGGWATALASGDRDAAAAALLAIVRDPAKAEAHGEAWGRLADLYMQLGYEMSAVGAWGKAFSLDGPRNAGSLATAFELAATVHDDRPIAEAVGKNVGIPVEGATRNDLAYTAARTQLDRGEIGLAVAVVALGDPGAPGYEDVAMMKGIVLAQQSRFDEAIEALQIAQATGVQNGRDQAFADLAALNLGRAYYGAGSYGLAISSYASVSRQSNHWLQAQFERAWSHFRGQDMNGALAMLFNHDTPFFAEDYHPEADLLRAYSLFIMCKFTDATAEINAFQERYEPMSAELAAISLTPQDAWTDVVAFVDDKPHQLPDWILHPFKGDPRLAEARLAVAHADKELARMEALSDDLEDVARKIVETERAEIVRIEGERVIDRVTQAREELSSMLAGIEITRLDLLNLEAQMYQRASATGVLDYGDRVEQLKELRKRKTGFHVWPFEGEYWADELGWFVFDARPDCPESMARGEDGAGP
jgi:tetratricopeptide (TPR) repeat protein